MAKPNYTFEKRQKEIAKKKKKEEKRLKKMEQASEETDAVQSPLISEQDTSIDSDTWDKNLKKSRGQPAWLCITAPICDDTKPSIVTCVDFLLNQITNKCKNAYSGSACD